MAAARTGRRRRRPGDSGMLCATWASLSAKASWAGDLSLGRLSASVPKRGGEVCQSGGGERGSKPKGVVAGGGGGEGGERGGGGGGGGWGGGKGGGRRWGGGGGGGGGGLVLGGGGGGVFWFCGGWGGVWGDLVGAVAAREMEAVSAR